MSTPSISRRSLSFWRLQTFGWLLYAAAMVTSNLPLWQHHDLITFRTTSLVCTFLESFVMYGVCHFLWRRAIGFVPTILVCSGFAVFLGFLCSAAALRLEIRAGGYRETFHWTNALSGAPAAAFVLIAWSALYFGVQQYRCSEAEKARATQAENSAREAQLTALRYQLQPHFLFNTLNAISSLVVIGENKAATEMISRLGSLLRSSLDSPKLHFVSLSEEIRIAQQYLDIEKLRFQERLAIYFDLDPLALDVSVPRFLLQPLLENSVRHGVSKLSRPGSITIRAAVQESTIVLTIKNDKDLSASTSNHNGSGLGLRNTALRIEQIYGSQGFLEINDRLPGHFIVRISFPAHQSKDEFFAAGVSN